MPEIKKLKMSRRNDPVDDFIRALSDERVKELLSGIFDDQLKAALLEIDELKRQNARETKQIEGLISELKTKLMSWRRTIDERT